MWLGLFFGLLIVEGRHHHHLRRQARQLEQTSCEEDDLANALSDCSRGCFRKSYGEIAACMGQCMADNMQSIQLCKQREQACGVGMEMTENGCVDTNECLTGQHSCHQYADCTDIEGGYSCECQDGFNGDGKHCFDFDECVLGIDECDTLAVCTNTPGSFECACTKGYEGDGHVCAVEDECYLGLHTCNQHATCTNVDEGHGFTCECLEGYLGDGLTCEDIDECTSEQHDCHIDALCVNKQGTYDCLCNIGYSGDGQSCTEIDECAEQVHNCDPNGTCINTPGSFDCQCNTGYYGSGFECIKDDDECLLGVHECGVNSFCHNTMGSYLCPCEDSYMKVQGECQPIDECVIGVKSGNSGCPEHASCVAIGREFKCQCDSGYVMDESECVRLDECSSGTHNCDEHATCTNTDEGFTCFCNMNIQRAVVTTASSSTLAPNTEPITEPITEPWLITVEAPKTAVRWCAKSQNYKYNNSGLTTANPYSNNEDIQEELTCADNETIKVRVDRLETEARYDFLRITTPDSAEHKFSGSELSNCVPLSTWFNVNSTSVTLGFTSDGSNTREGVDVIAQCVSRSSVTTLDTCGFGWTRFTIGGEEKMLKSIGTDQLQKAQSRCADLGARVPLPCDENENADYVVAFRELGSGPEVALGLNDVASEGDWRDNDGNTLVYTNWQSDQPNSYGGNQDYAHMRTSDGEWNDGDATYDRLIVCEK